MNGTKNRKDNIKKYLLFLNTSFGVVYMCDEVEDTIGQPRYHTRSGILDEIRGDDNLRYIQGFLSFRQLKQL